MFVNEELLKEGYKIGAISRVFIHVDEFDGNCFASAPEHVPAEDTKVRHAQSMTTNLVNQSMIRVSNLEEVPAVVKHFSYIKPEDFYVIAGFSTYPNNDRKLQLKTVLLDRFKELELDMLNIVFINGWDLYSLDDRLFNRSEQLKKAFDSYDISKIHFWLCNTDILDILKQILPGCNTLYYSIYPARMMKSVLIHGRPTYINKSITYKNKFRNHKAITLNNFKKTHREEIYNLIKQDEYTIASMRSDEDYLPVEITRQTLKNNKASYPKLNFFNDDQDHPPLRYMTDSYANVVCETHFFKYQLGFGDDVETYNAWFSEKTLKTFYYELPFIHVGLPGVLRSLRKLGFETFPEFFDESYDNIINDNDRMSAIKKTITDYLSLDLEDLHSLYHSPRVQEKILHNKNNFYKMFAEDPFINHYTDFENSAIPNYVKSTDSFTVFRDKQI